MTGVHNQHVKSIDSYGHYKLSHICSGLFVFKWLHLMFIRAFSPKVHSFGEILLYLHV